MRSSFFATLAINWWCRIVFAAIMGLMTLGGSCIQSHRDKNSAQMMRELAAVRLHNADRVVGVTNIVLKHYPLKSKFDVMKRQLTKTGFKFDNQGLPDHLGEQQVIVTMLVEDSSSGQDLYRMTTGVNANKVQSLTASIIRQN